MTDTTTAEDDLQILQAMISDAIDWGTLPINIAQNERGIIIEVVGARLVDGEFVYQPSLFSESNEVTTREAR